MQWNTQLLMLEKRNEPKKISSFLTYVWWLSYNLAKYRRKSHLFLKFNIYLSLSLYTHTLSLFSVFLFQKFNHGEISWLITWKIYHQEATVFPNLYNTLFLFLDELCSLLLKEHCITLNTPRSTMLSRSQSKFYSPQSGLQT